MKVGNCCLRELQAREDRLDPIASTLAGGVMGFVLVWVAVVVVLGMA